MEWVKQRKKSFLASIILIMGIILVHISIHEILQTSTNIRLNKVIIIDAGHGGIDGGAIGRSGVVESHINLEIALKLRSLLEENGAIVLLTRDMDEGLYEDKGRIRDKKNQDLRNRRKFVEESQADILVSIHLNSFPQSQYYGAQTFYPKNTEESKNLAQSIQQELIRVLNNGNSREPKMKSDVYLLKFYSIPTVLVECGFLSNPMEERLLQEGIYQEKVAWSIYIGILEYFHDEAEKNQS